MDDFQTNITTLYGSKGLQWLAQLPTLTEAIGRLWGLSQLAPVEEFSFNCVLSGYQGRHPVILKLSPDKEALRREVAALQAFQGYGVVKVLAHKPGALLLGGVVPGYSLKDVPQEQSALQVACGVMRRLHQAPYPAGDFPTITTWLATLDCAWDIPSALLGRARQLRDRHQVSTENPVLLHGDLHRGNILAQGNGWVAIDPKGVIGAPIHEVWAFIEKPEAEIPLIAHYFNFDPQLVWDWYFVRLVLAACWCCEDRLDPSKFLDLAHQVNHCMNRLP